MPFYNPGKIVTDILSKYLEFDPEQLKLGIWSGNLSITDVELKKDAMYPLLNGASLPSQNGKPPLNLKLVKGTVGHMRIRIPWKRLVWGQGDVKLQISDVTISVGYESREETAARNLPEENEPQEENETEESEEEKSKMRDLKQEWLREAERCQLRGAPLPTMQDVLHENTDEESNKASGQSLSASKTGRLDNWLKSTTESFAWRFVAGLDASIRNVRVVIVQDGVEIGTVFHSMDIVPRSLDINSIVEREKEDSEQSSHADPTLATPPPDVVPEGEYDDGEHLDKIVKLQGFGVFVRLEDKTNTTPKTLRFSASVGADDYILRPTQGDLAISIFDPYPPNKQKKKTIPSIEEEPTTPTTATDTVDSVTTSKSRRSKREKRPLLSDGTPTTAPSETQGSVPESDGKAPKQLRPALKRREGLSLSTRQFSLAEAPTTTGANRPKSNTVDFFGPTGGNHSRKASAVSRANLSRVISTDQRSRTSNMTGTLHNLNRLDDSSTVHSTTVAPGGPVLSPSLDLHLSFGDVSAMFSSNHYKLILEFSSTVERMKNGRPDKSIASGLDGFGPDKKRAVYVDALASDVKNLEDPALASQLPRPKSISQQRAQTTGSIDVSSPSPQRVKLQLHLELPSNRDKTERVIRSWWNYAYSAVLYEIRQRRIEESSFGAKCIQFDWEKQTSKRKEYVELYIAARLEPSSVLRSMELKVKLGSKSPEEELLRIEDELPVEQILLYRSIARSLRVRGMKKMPDSVLKIHGDQWLKTIPPKKRKTCLSKDPSLMPSLSPRSGSRGDIIKPAYLAEVEPDCTDIDGIRQEADAVRMRAYRKDGPKKQKSKSRDLLRENGNQDVGIKKRRPQVTSESEKAENRELRSKGDYKPNVDAPSTTKGDKSDGRTVRSFKTAKTSHTSASSGEKDLSSGRLRISASIAFSKVELMLYQESLSTRDSLDSMRFRLASSELPSSGVLDTRIRSSSGLQVVTNEDARSEVSDVSILSDDQLFFDQNDDVYSFPEGEVADDVPIMSSADFLMFGLPRNILLHASISGLVGKTRGQSGGQQIFSLSFDSVSIDGGKNSHLLSMNSTNPDTERPVDEIDAKKKEKHSRKQSAVSFAEVELFQDQAILISVVTKPTSSTFQCEMSKAVVTCDLCSVVKVFDFFTNIEVMFPKPLVTSNKISILRQYVMQGLAVEDRESNKVGEGMSSAIRLHGLEVAVPTFPVEKESSGSSRDTTECSNTEPKVRLLLSLIEYYDGTLFEDVFMLSSDFGEDGSFKTTGMLSSDDKSRQRRRINNMNTSKVADENHFRSSSHSVLLITGIECSVLAGMDKKIESEYRLLAVPVDVEVLYTQNFSVDFLATNPNKHFIMGASPLRVILSEARVDLLSKVATSFSTVTQDLAAEASTSTDVQEMMPRLAALSLQILVALEIRISCLRLTLSDDSVELQPTRPVREIIMEQSLSDFVSVLSCFNFDYPTKESVEAAGNICIDRIVVLGLSEDLAHDCVHAARLNFLAGIETIKKSQSETFNDLAECERSISREESCDEGSVIDSVPPVTEISDNDSAESFDIIESTSKDAVEKTMSSFGSLLPHTLPGSTSFSDILVVDLPAGVTLSMTKMFYDFRLECHFSSLNVFTASGLHLLRLRGLHSQDAKKSYDAYSSTAPGDSWAKYEGSPAMSFSFFQLDSEYNFGEGGLPLAILGSDDHSAEMAERPEREQLGHFALGNIEVFFNQKAFSQVIRFITGLMGSIQSNVKGGNTDIKPSSNADDESDSRNVEMQLNLYLVASSITVLLTSDELVPFCQIEVLDCTVDNNTESDLSTKRPQLNFEAKWCRVLDLTPEGYGYPEILRSFALHEVTNIDSVPSLTVHFYSRPDIWKEPAEMDIELRGIRLFLVRRFLNEVLQYMVSTDYGVGLLLDKLSSDLLVDSKGNRPPPFQYKATIVDSSIILPRCSTNIDMLALEVDEVTLFNGFAVSSFTLPTASSGLEITPNVEYMKPPTDGGDRFSRLSQRLMSNNSSSDPEFFDCADLSDSFDENGDQMLSSFRKNWIKRTTFLLEKFRLFTSLPSDSLTHPSSEDPLVHKFYGLKGRAIHGGLVYTGREEALGPKLNSVSYHEPHRTWREITSSECSLLVVSDFVPYLRLLITDNLVQQKEDGDMYPIDLDLRMSDLCLLLSVWYANMQELPVMFPYSPAVVEASATSTQPSLEVPEYGSSEYSQRLKTPSTAKADIAMVLESLCIRGSFDESGYFAEDPRSLRLYSRCRGMNRNRSDVGLLPFRLAIGNCVLHTTTDTDGILRLAFGSSGFVVTDEQRDKEFEEVFRVGAQIANEINEKDYVTDIRRSWAEMFWGLDCNRGTLTGILPQPFQATVFMTPGWCLTNLGFEHADVILTDFSPIWILVDYFAGYFSSAVYGNPVFEVAQRKDELKFDLRGSREEEPENRQVSMNMDFRLWLLHPCVCVPESLRVNTAPSLNINSWTGFWYHYRSIGPCTLQEMGSTDLSLRFSEEFFQPTLCRNLSIRSTAKTLVEGLSFGLRMDFNAESQHTNYVFRMPMFDSRANDADGMCSVTAPDYIIKPISLPPPTVCVPMVKLTRQMGSTISEVTLYLEVLPVTFSLLQNLVSGSSSVAESKCTLSKADKSQASIDSVKVDKGESSFAVAAHMDSFRIFAIDPILEKHLPVAALFISPLEISVSQLNTKLDDVVVGNDAFPSDLQFILKFLVWADYFKLGTTRSWEPLLEPFRCLVLYEKSQRRGHGLSLDSADAFHLNITGSLLLTLDENISSLSRAISETFGEKKYTSSQSRESNQGSIASRDAPGACVDDQLQIDSGTALSIRHEIPKPVPNDGRTAFSFRNLTGQKIRIHQLLGPGYSDESKSVVAYLDHNETTTLTFDATISVIRNLDIVEVPFPGLENPNRIDHGLSLVDHEVDVQVPGFRWLSGISVNTSGRQFEDLVPVSPQVLEKVQLDWRLQNITKILTEVGVENGGRLIAARSLFEIMNKTAHSVFIHLNPDPTQFPRVENRIKDLNYAKTLIEPGASFQVPSLLHEASLELDGHHLGCFWLRPIDSPENKDIAYILENRENDEDTAVIEFSSRPIQLAKLVHESALIFKSNGGEDLESEKVRSGVQVSCPVIASNEGVPVAPFCYVIEVRRSPLVKSTELSESVASPTATHKQQKTQLPPSKEEKSSERGLMPQFRAREDQSRFQHGPVSYSLRIHPPFVIENLLPKRGRFELMHATRRTVLWFGDLNPGERIPIHTVGLDAPLLLMLNLGFCRTPVGEGALVHHGSDATHAKGLYNASHGGLKSIGKAVTKGTKQFGKAVTAIAESPDKRGQGKLFLARHPQFSPFRRSSQERKTFSDIHVEGNTLGIDTGVSGSGGMIHGIEHESFEPGDVVDETVVVDSIGQRLTLKIDNSRGGGGQRRISLYCPLWIVNTTEHALLYKQEKGSSYVSGTVLSPTKDGSRPVDDSDRNYIHSGKSRISKGLVHEMRREPSRRKDVFGGTPGALARSSGRPHTSPETIVSLLDKDLSMQTLTEVAFMFNFHLDMLSIFRLCVQLSDGTGNSQYSSAWSQGFSLDSVGVNQIVSMPCKDGRALEVSMILSVAPGLLSGYTKIVRFTPRFVLVNYLERPVRLWQDSSLLHPLYEGIDHPGATAEQKGGSKWHFKDMYDPSDAVNQYEYLFGRPAALDEEDVDGMTAGTTASKSALYICTAGNSQVIPFHLPDTRGERQLRIDLGGSWNLTSSFSADHTGENFFKISRAVDSRLLSHVTTRESPQYRVVLPPPDSGGIDPWDGELGVWFETDWGGDRRIIVQGVKRDSYAFNYTDIHVGDELLRVDEFNVSQMTFQETMKVLKEKLAFMSVERKNAKPRLRASAMIRRRSKRPNENENGVDNPSTSCVKVVLTFRTLEERLRRVRIKALKARRVNALRQQTGSAHHNENLASEAHESLEKLDTNGERFDRNQQSSSTAIQVDMRMLQNTAFILVRQPDPQNPPFRIENRAMDRVVFFRQRSCSSYPWNQVMPGESLAYTWEEPLRAKKLVVRVGPSNAVVPVEHGDAENMRKSISTSVRAVGAPEGEMNDDDYERKRRRANRLKHLLSAQYVKNEEEGGLGSSVTVKLEVIGCTEILPFPKPPSWASNGEDFLNCYVDTDGITRVLIITDRKANEDERTDIKNHLTVLQQQIQQEKDRAVRIRELKSFIGEEEGEEGGEKRGEEEGANSPRATVVESQEDVGVSLAKRGEVNSRVTAQSKLSDSVWIKNDAGIETELQNLANFPEDVSITHCHQVYVEVMEAAGLRSTDASGMCNPYCEVALKERSQSRKSLRRSKKKGERTYYIENTTTPKWATQIFIFDISPEAVHATRGYSVRVRLRNFHWIGNHPSLGQASVYLSTLRNQQEVVGWYPLVGFSEKGDVDDSFSNYGRGSVKLRMQWIHSISGMLDYFLMLSERRLSNLKLSLEGMQVQLAHAIEVEKTREQYNSELSSLPLPQGLRIGGRKTTMSSGHIRRESRDNVEDIATGILTGKRLPRPSMVFKLRDNLRKSRELHMSQIDLRTSESRRRRHSSRKAVNSEELHLEPISSGASGSTITRGGFTGVSSSQEDIVRAANGSSQGSNVTLDDRGPDLQENFPDVHYRGRSLSVPDERSTPQSKVVFRDDSQLVDPEILDFSRLVQKPSLDRASSGHASVVYNEGTASDIDSDSVRRYEQDQTIENLFDRGFIHNKGEPTALYRSHLTYHVRPLLIESSLQGDAPRHSMVLSFRAKSTQRLSSVIRQFRTWTAAQAVFNDDDLHADVFNNVFYVKLNDSCTFSGTDDGESDPGFASINGSESEIDHVVAVKFRLPKSFPSAMRARSLRVADLIHNSRRQFERACKRSLRAVLNPGGWLTIRPMTALYLPDSCTGMFVKLRYGPEVVISETVEARVSPTWTADTTVQVTPFAHTILSSEPGRNSFSYGPSDLQVFIEPQRTSGSLRLSVIGEKLNTTKVELGVLEIPLGAAINCCVECMEEVREEQIGSDKVLRGSGIPAYVRWFPLMNPKEVVAVDGDLGVSSLPSESEQLRDNMFTRYFTPCIKLALIWQPNDDDDGESPNKAKPSGDVDVISEAPVSETYCNADIGRLSFALIDSQRAVELLSLYLDDIDVRYSITETKTRSALFLGNIQIDYQEENAREPVVLAPTPGDNSQPTLQFMAVKDNLRSKTNITSYEYIWLALQEMDLTLEEAWMFELWEFFIGILRRIDMRNMSTFSSRMISTDVDRAVEFAVLARSTPRGSLVEEYTAEPALEALLAENQDASYNPAEKKVYVGQLLLGYMKINLSYLKGRRSSWEKETGLGPNVTAITIGARGMIVGRHRGDSLSPVYLRWSERTQDEDLYTEADVNYSNLPKTIAAVFPSVSDAPIRLQGKVIEHVFESPDEIINSIKSYYQTEILSQIYKIIGALDFVGNPSMVFSSFLAGVRDFFVTPSEAFLRSPNDPSRVGIGVAKGTLSLFSHSASGIFGFISKMSASAGQVVATLSLDDDFKEWHNDVIVAEAKGLNRQWKRRGVQSVPTMLARPLYDVMRGLVLGATGIVVSPYAGARKRGCRGFTKGVAAGTIGIVAKPLVGVLDAFSHASGSVYDMAKSVNVLDKRYLPPKKLRLSYSFGPKGVLIPFDQVTARSVYLLETHPLKSNYYSVDEIRAMGDEVHVASEVLPMEPGVETYVVASSHRIVLFQVKKESSGDLVTRVRWQVDLVRATSISCKLQDQGHNGVALIISTTMRKKKVRIAKTGQGQSSPERTTARNVEDTPIPRETSEHLPLSDAISLLRYDAYDDDQQVSVVLGTDGSERGLDTTNHDRRDDDLEDRLHGSMKGKDGEVVEWYTIVAEYQQGPQLTRIHNAICCIIGDFDGILNSRSGKHDGTTEGITSFGELHFGKSPLVEATPTTPHYDKAVCEALNNLPWMYGTMFQALKSKNPETQQHMLNDMRNSWLFSREVSAALRDGTPADLVDTRARSTFIPRAPPALPTSMDNDDQVVSEILTQLEQGNISYDQACALIADHSKSAMLSTPSLDGSDVSSVTEPNDRALDQQFLSATEKLQSESDLFFSARQRNSTRTPPEIRFFDGRERTPSQLASVSGELYASRPSLPFLDALDSRELHSLADKSLEHQSLSLKTQTSDEGSVEQQCLSTSSLPLHASRGAHEILIPSAEPQALRKRTESAPVGMIVPKTTGPPSQDSKTPPMINNVPPSGFDSWLSQEESPHDQSRLSRMESMLGQLIVMNAQQLGRGGGFRLEHSREEPEMIALRQEIADLRAQVQRATSDGSRKDMIAALRKEIQLLKEELQMEKSHNEGQTDANHVYSDVEHDTRNGKGSQVRFTQSKSIGPVLEDQLNQIRPAAAKFARNLENRGASMARRLRTGTSPTIPEGDEDDREVASF